MKNGSTISFACSEPLLLLRQSLGATSPENGRFKMIFECADCEELIINLPKLDAVPDVCIISIREGENLITATDNIALIRKDWPSMRILIFTPPLYDYFIVQFIKAGVNGILNARSAFLEDIFEAMKLMYLNGYFYGGLTNRETFSAIQERKTKVSPLSKMEIELIRFACEGKSYKQIAAVLDKDYFAVYMACKRLKQKLNLKEKNSLAFFGFHAGMHEPSPEQHRYWREKDLFYKS